VPLCFRARVGACHTGGRVPHCDKEVGRWEVGMGRERVVRGPRHVEQTCLCEASHIGYPTLATLSRDVMAAGFLCCPPRALARVGRARSPTVAVRAAASGDGGGGPKNALSDLRLRGRNFMAVRFFGVRGLQGTYGAWCFRAELAWGRAGLARGAWRKKKSGGAMGIAAAAGNSGGACCPRLPRVGARELGCVSALGRRVSATARSLGGCHVDDLPMASRARAVGREGPL